MGFSHRHRYTDEACTTALPAKYTMDEGKNQVVLYAKVTGTGSYKSDTSKVVSFVLYRAEEGKIDLSKARIVDPATGKKLGKQEYSGRAVEPAIKVQVFDKFSIRHEIEKRDLIF